MKAKTNDAQAPEMLILLLLLLFLVCAVCVMI